MTPKDIIKSKCNETATSMQEHWSSAVESPDPGGASPFTNTPRGQHWSSQGSTGQARGALPQIRGGHYPTSPQSPNLKIQMPPFDNPNLTNVQLQKNIQYWNQLSNQSLHHGHMTHPKTVHGDTPRQKIQISQQCTNTFVSHSNQYCHTHGQPKHKNSHDHHHSQTVLKTNQHLASLHQMLKPTFSITSSHAQISIWHHLIILHHII